jgi:type II secretory pathway component GspD/PulD (secretin)
MQGVPYLDKIPFLGNAFQYQARSSQRTELVIMITPRSITKNI